MILKLYGRNGSRPSVSIIAGEVSLSRLKALEMAIQSLYDSTNIEVLATPLIEGKAYVNLENKKYILELKTEEDPRPMVLKFALREIGPDEFYVWTLDAVEIELTNKAKGTSFKIAPPEYEPSLS